MKGRRGRPYFNPPTVILRCFVVRIWLMPNSDRSLHDYFATIYYQYNRKVLLKACGLNGLPDRRLSTISADIKEKITALASLAK